MKKIMLLLIVVLLYSCEKKNDIITENVADKLKTAKYTKPSVYGQEDLFIVTKENEIVKTNADFLNYLYELRFNKSYSSFKEFLLEVLNQNNNISKDNFKNIGSEIFVLDNAITKEYEKGFDFFYNNYTKKINQKSEKIILKVDRLNKKQFLTVQFYFYINDYQVQEDDYSGFYFVNERKIVFK